MRLNDTGGLAAEITKVAPPISITGLTLAGVTLSDWVLLVTLFYTVMQCGWFIYTKFIRKEK